VAIDPPDLPRELEERALEPTDFDPDVELYGLRVTAVTLPDKPVRRWSVQGSRFEGADLAGAELPILSLVDCALENCELANVAARDSSLRRVLFAGGRLTGLQLIDGELGDVAFGGCRADLASFYGARLERVTFEGCVLRDADFRGASLHETTFADCELTAADFNGTRFDNCVLRGTSLDGVAGIERLDGVAMPWSDIVANAGAFAGALGVRVRDEDDGR
jgi:uncharacterized protein YjbI with pentapeptide repeats